MLNSIIKFMPILYRSKDTLNPDYYSTDYLLKLYGVTKRIETSYQLRINAPGVASSQTGFKHPFQQWIELP